MSRYILAGFESEELEQKIKDHQAFALVRELNFKYNLKVLGTTEYQHGTAFQMCHTNGMAVGKVFVRAIEDGKTEYCYRTPYYKKERGSSEEDKETLRSVKVSSLMSSIKRVKAIPDLVGLVSKKMAKINSAMGTMRHALGSGSKSSSELEPNEIQALICSYLGESPSGNHIAVDAIKCQKVLDKYIEADRVAVKKVEEVKRLFHNPFYMIGADGFGHFIVGKVKVVGDKEYEIVDMFKRYKDITECEGIIPVMTMTKLAYGDGSSRRLQNGYIPIMDAYDENLDAVFFYDTQATHYDYIWMATPC